MMFNSYYCLNVSLPGNHPQLAEMLLQEGVFFITTDTVQECGAVLAHCLEVWVEEEPESKVST